MTDTTLTAVDILAATLEDLGLSWETGDVDYCTGYAEPGYGPDNVTVVFANWNHDNLRPLADAIEATDGLELEWYDEWTRCEECYRAMRTQPDSYSWKMYGAWWDDYGYVCADCLLADLPSALEQYHDNPERAVTWCTRGDLLAAGWEQWEPADPRTFETGWHPGQDDDPRTVLATIRETIPEEERAIVFLIDGTGQFDIRWSAWLAPLEDQEGA